MPSLATVSCVLGFLVVEFVFIVVLFWVVMVAFTLSFLRLLGALFGMFVL